jgi:hypothetical protein
MGWYDQMVAPQLTRCCTQTGELAAVGWMTSAGSPAAIFGCACKIPSRIQSAPNPMRSSHRPLASPAPVSAEVHCTRAAPVLPVFGRTPGAVNGQVRAVAQTSQRNTTRMRAMAP